jgi:glutathione peroxidase
VTVKGEKQVPLFQYLTKAENPDFDGEIKWNFEKFLVGKDGKLLRRYRSKTQPLAKEITDAIENALK